jgi:hypothetical protein
VKGYPRTATGGLGWHFTNCYDADGIRTKAIGITTHYGICGVDEVPSADKIRTSLEQGKNPFKTRWVKGELQEVDVVKGKYVEARVKSATDLEWAPKYIREHPEKFPFYTNDESPGH